MIEEEKALRDAVAEMVKHEDSLYQARKGRICNNREERIEARFMLEVAEAKAEVLNRNIKKARLEYVLHIMDQYGKEMQT